MGKWPWRADPLEVGASGRRPGETTRVRHEDAAWRLLGSSPRRPEEPARGDPISPRPPGPPPMGLPSQAITPSPARMPHAGPPPPRIPASLREGVMVAFVGALAWLIVTATPPAPSPGRTNEHVAPA